MLLVCKVATLSHACICTCSSGAAHEVVHIFAHVPINLFHGFNSSCVPLQAYTTLSDPFTRLKYNARLQQALQDAEDDYTGKLLFSAAQPYASTSAHHLSLAACTACLFLQHNVMLIASASALNLVANSAKSVSFV